ncbi:MAG: cache domain-containing protein, partial [Cyanobacteria bacterium J06642_11]
MSTAFQSSPSYRFSPLTSPDRPQARRKNRRLLFSSFGGRLFWIITLGLFAGMGSMALFFSQMLKEQAEEQVRSSLDGKVNAIASVTDTAETMAYGLGVSATTLHERRAQYPDTYREILLQLFERRPEFVIGLGLGQSKNGIVTEQPWMFPYYSVITSQEDTSFDQDTIIYEDFADNVGEFYPNTERYRDYFLPQTSLWTEPYQVINRRVLTYYLPMFGNDGDWLGTILVDIDSQSLSQFLDDPVFRQAGHYMLVTQSGAIIADSANADVRMRTYKDVDELEAVWPQINMGDTDFLRGQTGYWAYAPVPGQDWMLLGYVPYTAVYGRIIRVATVTTTLLLAIVTLVLYVAVRKLNRRLKPILLQCDQLPQTNAELWVDWEMQDELDQLSLAFFKLLEQLNQQEATIRRYQQAL